VSSLLCLIRRIYSFPSGSTLSGYHPQRSFSLMADAIGFNPGVRHPSEFPPTPFCSALFELSSLVLLLFFLLSGHGLCCGCLRFVDDFVWLSFRTLPSGATSLVIHRQIFSVTWSYLQQGLTSPPPCLYFFLSVGAFPLYDLFSSGDTPPSLLSKTDGSFSLFFLLDGCDRGVPWFLWYG